MKSMTKTPVLKQFAADLSVQAKSLSGRDLVLFARDLVNALPMVAFLFFYLLWFWIVENVPRQHFYEIHTMLDDVIPFCEVSIVPYLLWFPFMLLIMVFMFFTDRRIYHRLSAMLVIGMIVFLTISTLFPNIQYLRPAVMPRDNIFTRQIMQLYQTDTPTNICPSIHVYNSICANIAVLKSRSRFARKKWLRVSVTVLVALIVLSTMFIKQHSVLDVVGAFAMSTVCYSLVYDHGFVMTDKEERRRKPVKIFS